MRFMACRIDASLQEHYYKRNDSFFTRCVRDCSGILCERFGNEIRERGRELGRDLKERDGNIASKDTAESPTALPERPERKTLSRRDTEFQRF